MTNNSDTIQLAFDGSAGATPLRKIVLTDLPALRHQNSPLYWDHVRDMPALQTGDLETLLPRATLPQIVDGPISYKGVDFLSPTRALKEYETITRSETAATQFLELVDRLEQEDPGFMAEYASGLFSGRAMDYVMALHIMGQRDDLRDLFLKRAHHIDDLVLQVLRSKEEFLDNTHYPFDNQFTRLTDELASAYILKKAPFMDGRGYATDEEMRPFLEIARDYCYSSKIIESINTKFPLPKSFPAIHSAGLGKVTALLHDDLDMAHWMLDRRDRFAGLSADEKLEFGGYYLWFLTKSYGVNPPPELQFDPECKSQAAQTIWNLHSKEECFAHPLGRITVQELPDDVDEFLELLSHEFIHGLEDVALFTMNPEFKAWHEQNPDAVQIGSEIMQKNLRSAGLALSFNSHSGAAAAFAGIRGAGSQHGAYYAAASPDEKDTETAKALLGRYLDQLRERHAYGYQGIIAGQFTETLDMIAASRDPLRVFMMAQNAIFKADDFIKGQFIPTMPPDLQDRYAVRLREIQNHFKAADARDATYRQRLQHMGLAFNTLRGLITDASDDGFMDLAAPETREMYGLCNTITDYAIQGIQFMDWKKQKEAAAVEVAPAPAAT